MTNFIKVKRMPTKWYQSRQIQAAIISGVFIIILGFLTTPLWLKNSKSVKSEDGVEMKPEDRAHIQTKSSAPITLKIVFDLKVEKADSVIGSLRRAFALRELKPLESGKSINETPSGTFFYLHVIYLDRGEDFVADVLSRGGISRNREGINYFEIFKVAEDQIFIVGFTSSERASSISRLNGLSKKEIILSPLIWNGVNCLSLVPIDRILAGRVREISTDDNEAFFILDAAIQ